MPVLDFAISYGVSTGTRLVGKSSKSAHQSRFNRNLLYSIEDIVKSLMDNLY